MMTQMHKSRRRSSAGAAAAATAEAACCDQLARAFRPGLFKALGDPNRMALLVRLAACGRPCTVSELAACCPTDLSVVSRHLATLRDAGILAAEKRGRQVYYTFRYQDFCRAFGEMSQALNSCCQPTSLESDGKGFV